MEHQFLCNEILWGRECQARRSTPASTPWVSATAELLPGGAVVRSLPNEMEGLVC